MPRSGLAPRLCSCIRRWCSRGHRWSDASRTNLRFCWRETAFRLSHKPSEPIFDIEALEDCMSADFLLTTLIVVISPGTGVLYTLAAGLSRGSRASIVAAFGCTLGIVPHMAAAILGLAALLHTSALAFQTLKYLGVAYLLFMAWQALKEHGALRVDKDVDAKSAMQVIIHAILINILNPKLSIFFFAFLPQFVSTNEAQPLSRMLELSGVFM